MISRSKNQSVKSSRPSREQKKSSVYVVFSTTMNKETGAQLSRQVIGIFEDQKNAEKLEEVFNKQEQKGEDVTVKAFCMRYGVPYVAPIAEQLLDGDLGI